MRVCVRACTRALVRACFRARAHACAHARVYDQYLRCRQVFLCAYTGLATGLVRVVILLVVTLLSLQRLHKSVMPAWADSCATHAHKARTHAQYRRATCALSALSPCEYLGYP